ncbi:hypothetical protein RHMOL_Rhmol11G0070900 [Rhododendron molle]|uniref:Uncharacterized protein n=1 Tax=Rhododendron molle TaxID=49168 RepID=A0ACC0LR41_RHOML|nr:hypothetical protein RHMOL_Rhmol11G0070900 [Rhododendron molle]
MASGYGICARLGHICTIVVEGDSQQVVQILNRDILCPTDVEVVIEDIRGLARRFVSCLFQFVRRSANVVADTLASHGEQEIGGLLIEKDIVEEKLEVAEDIIDDFVAHTVTQTYQSGENVGENESKAKKVDAMREKHEIENVEEEEEEEEEGGGIEIVQDEGGPEHIMVANADVDSTTVEAYKSILESDTPKRKRGKTKVKVKSSSLTRGVKKTFTRVEKRLDDYVYVDLKKGAKKSSKQKWNPSEAPLIGLLRSTDANLLRQIIDCSDADLQVDYGVIICMLMELFAHLEPIPKILPKTEIDQFRVGLVSRFLNDEGRSWTIKKWEARRMGKGSH